MNLFCFVVDKKSTALFKEQISNLTECFPNAISSQRQLSIDSAGHNMLNGFFECFRLLLTRPKWKYLITLQVILVIISGELTVQRKNIAMSTFDSKSSTL